MKQFEKFLDRVKRGIMLYEYEGEDPQFQWGVDVTDVVAAVLGDIVESALWIIGSGYSEKSMVEEAEYLEGTIKTCLEKGDINFDGDDVIIRFTSGKELILWNSEWGGIRPNDEKTWDKETIEKEKAIYPVKEEYGCKQE